MNAHFLSFYLLMTGVNVERCLLETRIIKISHFFSNKSRRLLFHFTEDALLLAHFFIYCNVGDSIVDENCENPSKKKKLKTYKNYNKGEYKQRDIDYAKTHI